MVITVYIIKMKRSKGLESCILSILRWAHLTEGYHYMTRYVCWLIQLCIHFFFHTRSIIVGAVAVPNIFANIHFDFYRYMSWLTISRGSHL